MPSRPAYPFVHINIPCRQSQQQLIHWASNVYLNLPLNVRINVIERFFTIDLKHHEQPFIGSRGRFTSMVCPGNALTTVETSSRCPAYLL